MPTPDRRVCPAVHFKKKAVFRPGEIEPVAASRDGSVFALRLWQLGQFDVLGHHDLKLFHRSLLLCRSFEY
jgi:hypothetical protein